MNNEIKANNIISLFLALTPDEQKKVLAELQKLVDKPQGGKNISEEKL